MARSTCMRVDAICLVSCSSSIVRWSLSLRKGGIFIVTPFGRREWSISKPLSAIMESPDSSSVKIPQSTVACLSLVLPAYRSETKEIIPEGEIPTNPLAVL